jgi:hypothetical protein
MKKSRSTNFVAADSSNRQIASTSSYNLKQHHGRFLSKLSQADSATKHTRLIDGYFRHQHRSYGILSSGTRSDRYKSLLFQRTTAKRYAGESQGEKQLA